MLKKITQFIKYNTFAAAIIAIAFIAVASALAANEDVKKVIGEEIVEKSGVDNTALLAADLEELDLKMEITNALEDEENYYIDYQYNTLAIKDNVWQEVLVKEQMTVSKESLNGRDLGLYLMEELGEVIDYQLAFLKEVQEKEEEKGVTVVLEKTEYTGLIGKIFNTKTRKLPEYEPVIKPPVAEISDASQDDFTQSPDPTGEAEPSIGSSVSGEEYDNYTGAPEENDYSDDSYYYKWCLLQENKYWDDGTCNDKPEEEDLTNEEPVNDEPAGDKPTEPADEPAAEDPATDAGHLDDEPAVKEEPSPADEDKPEIEPATEDELTEETPAEETEIEEPVADENLEDRGDEKEENGGELIQTDGE